MKVGRYIKITGAQSHLFHQSWLGVVGKVVGEGDQLYFQPLMDANHCLFPDKMVRFPLKTFVFTEPSLEEVTMLQLCS